jgi:hypothetical protein
MLAYLFVLMAAAVHIRWIALPFSFTPVLAALLYFGARMPRKRMWIPIAVLAASDIYLNRVVYGLPMGFDQVITWAFYAAIVLFGAAVIKGWSPLRITGATLAGSISFYLVSNFAVWMTGTMYPKTAAGLTTCMVAGLPFFRTALLSDLLFAGAFFGIGYLLSREHAASTSAA